MGINRRQFSQSIALGAAGLGLGTHATATHSSSATETPWQTLLGTNLDSEYDYIAEVEGTIPTTLRGCLYRNGPGLFERDGFRKATLLDGDGMIQAIGIGDGKVRYRNRFVRTDKFLAEQEAGRFLMPTWASRAPGFLDNFPGTPGGSQAGVTTYVVNGKLYAIDEAGNPWVLDPKNLNGDHEEAVLSDDPAGSYKAHTKFDAKTGDWILLGWTPGRHTDIDIIIKHPNGKLKSHRRTRSPRGGYVHDFFNSENYVVVLLHAVSFNPFPMLAGFSTFADSLSWEPEIGNIVLVIPKDTGAPVRSYEAPPSWMWHSFNAYEQGHELIVDFIGYDAPDHFLGENATLRTIMQGRLGDARYPGIPRRYRMELRGDTLVEEQLAEGNFEFPIIHENRAGQAHSHGFATTGAEGQFFHCGIAAIDLDGGQVRKFDFGERIHVGEPIFVPSGADERQGHLLAMCLDGSSGRSFVAIFDAGSLENGPLARIMLTHHTPLSFHGFWQPA